MGNSALNHDVRQYRYNDYVEAGGVAAVEEWEEFCVVLRQLAQCDGFYDEILRKRNPMLP